MGKKKIEPLIPAVDDGGQLSFDLGGGHAPCTLIENDAPLYDILQDIKQEEAPETASTELMDPKKKVVVSNDFVVGLEDGSRFAHRISRIAIAQIPMDADELPMTTITTDDIVAMGMTKQRMTGHWNKVLDEILNYRIKLASVDGLHSKRLTGINVFSMASINAGKGSITVQLNPMLKKHFLALKSDFTQYALPIVTKMSGYASSKLHELLLSRAKKYDTDLLRFRIDDLVLLLNYKPKDPGGKIKPSTFVNSTIKRAVENIQEHTECDVRYMPVKTGREYTDIRFYVDYRWKTLEEKLQYKQWEAEAAEKDPLYKKMLDDAEEALMERLRTGKGELVLDAKENHGL